MSKERLRSTGRKPALSVSGVQALLERYTDGSNASIEAIASEQKLTPATIRKYLKAAGLSLPRGRAALKPRESVSVRALMNRMDTAFLVGEGRAELLRRRLAEGESMTALAEEFGISRDRVRRFRDEHGLAPVKDEPAVEESTEVAQASAEEVSEVSSEPEAGEDAEETAEAV